MGQKLLLWATLILAQMGYNAIAQGTPPYEANTSVTRQGERYFVQASFVAPLSLCQAYSFITDYEGAKNIPGVSESKIISQEGNVTQVARVAREQLLLFSIELHSVIQYTQRPKDYAVDFVQLSGDTHYYRGTWRLREQGNNTVFTYQSEVEPNSVFPNWVIEYFIHQRMDERVQTMAQRASAYVPKVSATCP